MHLIQFICDVIVGYHGKLGYYGCGFLVVVLLFVLWLNVKTFVVVGTSTVMGLYKLSRYIRR